MPDVQINTFPAGPTSPNVNKGPQKRVVDAAEFIGNTSSPFDYVTCFDKFESEVECTMNGRIWETPTVMGLNKAIPERCRERSLEISMMFLIRDVLFLAANAALAHYLIPWFCGKSCFLRFLSWCTFAVTQGTIATGVWVIGHECGHGAFSPYVAVNDGVGFIVHTILLVPYYAWQFTHNKHHKYTNHLTLGETHVPPTISEIIKYKPLWRVVGDQGFAAFQVFLHLVLGWPSYLLANATGGRESHDEKPLVDSRDGGGPMDHFRSNNSQLFPPEVRRKVDLSTNGIMVVVAVLSFLGIKLGWRWLACWYIGPYLVANAWVVLYTWLHHGDPNVPHYGRDAFTWFRGAISTVDRNYPWIIDQLHHHIGTTHVVHHFDARIPHYHAVHATKCAQSYLGPYYRVDAKPLWKTLWRAAGKCHYVSATEGVQFTKAFSSFAL
eukprot:Selendium_serpulae@DN3074_c0_g1_i1.p1